MPLDDAIKQMESRIKGASAGAQIKVVKMSDEEARMTILAPSGEMQAIKDATFQPALDLLTKDGLDVQVFVYDKDAPPLTG